MENIKNFIRCRRIELGLTMKQVADAVGVSEGTVSRWESGNIANMKRSRMVALSNVLHISPLDLLSELPTIESSAAAFGYTPETEIAPDIRMLARAKEQMSDEEWQDAMQVMRLAFKKYFPKDDGGTDAQ